MLKNPFLSATLLPDYHSPIHHCSHSVCEWLHQPTKKLITSFNINFISFCWVLWIDYSILGKVHYWLFTINSCQHQRWEQVLTFLFLLAHFFWNCGHKYMLGARNRLQNLLYNQWLPEYKIELLFNKVINY